jgi:hypothetical protein
MDSCSAWREAVPSASQRDIALDEKASGRSELSEKWQHHVGWDDGLPDES